MMHDLPEALKDHCHCDGRRLPASESAIHPQRIPVDLFTVYWQGLCMGASLIVAIGAQNAFVLTQSIRNSHALPVSALCACIDVALITAGVGGVGALVAQSAALRAAAALGGAAFLLWFGAKSLRQAFRNDVLAVDEATEPAAKPPVSGMAECAAARSVSPPFSGGVRPASPAFGGAASGHASPVSAPSGQSRSSLRGALAATLAVSLLNPHVYLDTVVMLGAISGNYPGDGRYAFGAGAATASVLWFFSLCFAGRVLAPVFKNPRAWQCLNLFVCLLVWWIAATLLYGYFTPAVS